MLLLDSPTQERWTRSGGAETILAQRTAALAREIAAATVSVNIEDGYDCASLAQRIGRPLATAEVARRLKLINPRFVAERSVNFPDMTGLYMETFKHTEAGTWVTQKQFLFTMASGDVMPEMEVAHVRMKRVPNPEFIEATGGAKVDRDLIHWIEVPEVYDLTRGWRTVLIRLLRAGFVNRGDVELHFQWTPSQDSPNWAAQT